MRTADYGARGYPLENENQFTILIADRNPNVRGFLKREMMAEGYRVRLAKDSREVLKWVFSQAPLNLLILDPDLPDGEEVELFKQITDRIPQLPVVIHSFKTDGADHSEALITTVFVEKQGNSIEYLKKVVSEMVNHA